MGNQRLPRSTHGGETPFLFGRYRPQSGCCTNLHRLQQTKLTLLCQLFFVSYHSIKKRKKPSFSIEVNSFTSKYCFFDVYCIGVGSDMSKMGCTSHMPICTCVYQYFKCKVLCFIRVPQCTTLTLH